MSNYEYRRNDLFGALGITPPSLKEDKKINEPIDEDALNKIRYRHFLLKGMKAHGHRITKESVEEIEIFLESDVGKKGFNDFLNSNAFIDVVKNTNASKNRSASALMIRLSEKFKK